MLIPLEKEILSHIYVHLASSVATINGQRITWKENMTGNLLQVSVDLPIDPGHTAARLRLMSLIYPPAGWSSNYSSPLFNLFGHSASFRTTLWTGTILIAHCICSCRGDQSNAFCRNEFVIIRSAVIENWWLLLWQATKGEICHWTTSQYSSVTTLSIVVVIKMKKKTIEMNVKTQTLLDCNDVDCWHWQWEKCRWLERSEGGQVKSRGNLTHALWRLVHHSSLTVYYTDCTALLWSTVYLALRYTSYGYVRVCSYDSKCAGRGRLQLLTLINKTDWKIHRPSSSSHHYIMK